MSVYEFDELQIRHWATLIQKIQNIGAYVINMNTEQRNSVECFLENQESFLAPGLNFKDTGLELKFCVETKKKSVVLARWSDFI